MQALYGLIGYPLGHSFSALYFLEKFTQEGIDAHYELFSLSDINEYPQLLKTHSDLKGLNVTVPYKESVIHYLDTLDETAFKVGAVNTINIENGKTTGYNTDIAGFEKSLAPLLKPWHTRALILGTGGASKAVAYVLRKLKIDYQKVSRNKLSGSLSYGELKSSLISNHKLIINTTPLGMYPKTDAAPSIAYEAISEEHLAYDLIYNPEETKFLSLCKRHGAQIKNGLEMLHLQADAAWDIWKASLN